jgi:hypothetical protein
LAHDLSAHQASNRFNEILIDTEMERLLIQVFASHDELVDALSDLHKFHRTSQDNFDLKELLSKAEGALQNAFKVRQAD